MAQSLSHALWTADDRSWTDVHVKTSAYAHLQGPAEHMCYLLTTDSVVVCMFGTAHMHICRALSRV